MKRWYLALGMLNAALAALNLSIVVTTGNGTWNVVAMIVCTAGATFHFVLADQERRKETSE